MATANKSDRKKLIATEVYGGTVVFQRVDSGEEFGRVSMDDLGVDIQRQLMVYGAKQVIADVVASADGIEAKVRGMQAAIASLENGAWPKRTSEVSIDKAAETLAASMGITVDQLKAMLGK